MAEAKAKATAKAVATKAATTATKAATTAKKAATTATKKATTTAKKTPAKKADAATKVKAVVNFQFDGKSYTNDDLIASAKDVWKYDLEQKPADLKSIELYVKPEDSAAYYVFNGEITGSFLI